MKKKIDIFSLLPSNALAAVDEHAVDFLRSRGYDIKDLSKKRAKKALRDELRQRGEEIRYKSMVDKESGAILIWFLLYRNGIKIARSKGIKFLQDRKE